MRVAMRRAIGYCLFMSVPVVFVVDVGVFVLNLRMQVLVSVPLCQVQPNSEPHQSRRSEKVSGNLIAQD